MTLPVEWKEKMFTTQKQQGFHFHLPRLAVTWVNSWLLVGACEAGEAPEHGWDKQNIADLSLQLLRQKDQGSGVSQCVQGGVSLGC